jgi:hypothetical protein
MAVHELQDFTEGRPSQPRMTTRSIQVCLAETLHYLDQVPAIGREPVQQGPRGYLRSSAHLALIERIQVEVAWEPGPSSQEALDCVQYRGLGRGQVGQEILHPPSGTVAVDLLVQVSG